MHLTSAILIALTVTALMASAGCTSQSPPQTIATAPVSPTPVAVSVTALPVPPETTTAITTTVLPVVTNTVSVNDIISLDNVLYYVYAQDSSVDYLREVEKDAETNLYVYSGTGTAIQKPVGDVNTNAHYVSHIDPYGSDAVRSRTATGGKPIAQST